MLDRLSTVLGRIAAIRAQLEELASASPRAARFNEVFTEVLGCAAHSGRTPQVDELVRQAAQRYGVAEDLIHAVIRAESDYDPRCISSAGAMGLMQLMPTTAHSLGISDPWNLAQNIDGGTRYLRQQLDRFGDLQLALAAYNAGPAAVSRHRGVPPYPETRAYVQRVLRYLSERSSGP